MKESVERVVTWVLAIALVGSILATGFLAVNPPETTDPYTEFYVLGPEGNASEYPTNLSVGASGSVIVGVSNHEHREQTYTVVTRVDNETVDSKTVRVADEETWEDEVSFSVEETGRQQVRFLLFKGEGVGDVKEPYRYLRLWVNASSEG